MSASIDHRLGMVAHHAIDQKSARQSMLRRNLQGYIPGSTSSISCAHGVIACPFSVMPEAV
jgi:hypothetical protein